MVETKTDKLGETCEWEYDGVPEQLPSGLYVLRVRLGDERKARTKLWAKKVTSVDVTKSNGYAFAGEFARGWDMKELLINDGDVAVAVIQTGSWKNPNQIMRIYKLENGKLYKHEMPWGSPALNAKVIYFVASLVNKKNEQAGQKN